MSENPKYEYKCIDNSVLTPYFRKYVAAPVLEWIPKSVHPNLITVISSIFSVIALYISYRFGQGLLSNIMIGMLVFMYLLSDHLDGMQAKRRGGGTALGEYLDHFLDVINNGIFLLVLVIIFKVESNLVIILMFTLGYFAQAAVFFEQYKTGWIVFGKYESFEAVVALILMLLITSITPVYDLLMMNMAYDLRIIDWIFIFTSISGSFILRDITKRVGSGIFEMMGLIVAILTSLLIGYFFQLVHHTFGLVSIAAIFIIQEYMIARLTYKRTIWMDYLPTIVLIACTLFSLVNGFYIVIAGLIFIRFVITVMKLSSKN